MQTKRKLSTDAIEKKSSCCQRLSTFACVCAIVSLLVNIYHYVETDDLRDSLNVETSNLMEKLLDDRLEERIEAYFKDKTECTSHRLKREALLKSSPDQEDNTVVPHVEFFNPKMRGELEEKDAAEMARTGAKGPAPGGDSWVWLTSYSRVPSAVVQDFCKATQNYCPPGVQGPKGSRGESGPKGDRGDPGVPGSPGNNGGRGPIGPPGPKGERGFPGNPGLDGRDGVPGEPGLDGLPGRNGADGAPGKDGRDGIPGKDGTPGKNGKDGKDGRTGPQGPPGPRGLKGDRGIQGPKGQSGTNGKNGDPGKPGLSIYNNTKENQLLIPPTFAGEHHRVIATEDEPLRISCNPAGYPTPTVEWRRTDDTPMSQGKWRDVVVSGNILSIPKVTRWVTGQYVCLANNGINPPANQTTDVEVNFSPFVTTPNNVIYIQKTDKAARLECAVEAWPEPVRAWEFKGVTCCTEGARYKMETITTPLKFRFIMRLDIHDITHRDIGRYSCVAKNDMNNQTVRANIDLKYAIPGEPTPEPVTINYLSRATYSPSYDEMCQEKTCPACPTRSCDTHLMILSMNKTSQHGLNRHSNCQLYAIGKPVYHRFKDEQFGAWLRDSNASTDIQREKLWTTQEADAERLLEFRSKSRFKSNTPDEFHKLQKPFFGNGHIVYSGSFFYQANESGVPGDIIRYDLNQSRIKTVSLPFSGGRLYSAQHNQVDFSADDNGLWAIYSMRGSNNTAVAKLSFNPDIIDLNIDYLWNISLNHRQKGEMFIVCGVLYALESATERDTKVVMAIDLYLNQRREVSLQFTNPFRRTTQLGYDHTHKELYSWDRGNQLTYPVRSHDLPGP